MNIVITSPDTLEQALVQHSEHEQAVVDFVKTGFFEFDTDIMDDEDVEALEQWCETHGTGGYYCDTGWVEV